MENKMFLTVLGLQATLSVLTILALLTQPAHAESAQNPLQNIAAAYGVTLVETFADPELRADLW
jgi:hypothetical protein